MPGNSLNPIPRSRLAYIRCAALHVVRQFRIGGPGMTFCMDDDGAAEILAAMGSNLRRVKAVPEHLDARHNGDVDDVAAAYVNEIQKAAAIVDALKSDPALLIRVTDEFVATRDGNAIAYLQSL